MLFVPRFLLPVIPAVVALSALCAPDAGATPLQFCNQSTEKVSFAIQHAWVGAPDPVFGSQTGYARSFGWYRLAPGGCTTVEITPAGYGGSDRINLYGSGDRGTVWYNANGPTLCVGNNTGVNFQFDSTQNHSTGACQTAGGYHARGFANGFQGYTFTGGSTTSTLTVCNERPDHLGFGVAIAYWSQNHWVSRGWTPVESGCKTITLGNFSGDLYFNAMFANGNFYIVPQGPHFCVNALGPFQYDFADNIPCNGPGERRLPMGKITFTAGQQRTQVYK